jgi:hypothetical protein
MHFLFGDDIYTVLSVVRIYVSICKNRVGLRNTPKRWDPFPDPAYAGALVYWVAPFFFFIWACNLGVLVSCVQHLTTMWYFLCEKLEHSHRLITRLESATCTKLTNWVSFSSVV